MRITYFALKNIRVGGEVREAGSLVPEARDWPWLTGYLQNGELAPVLVATLPEETQEMLIEWDKDTRPDVDSTEVPEEGEDAEINKDDEEGGVPMEQPAEDVVKPKRKRRTKAEIEADNARIEAEKAEQKEAV